MSGATIKQCPSCKEGSLLTTEVDAGLTGLACSACSGQWIAAASYWAFIELEHATGNATDPATDTAPHDTRASKLCPDCGKLLTRYNVGRDIEFGLDRCVACGGFWLDRGEYLSLKRAGLHRQMHLITSAGWQFRVAAEQRETAHQQTLVEKLGPADLAEAKRVKAWIEAHPQRVSIIAYLVDPKSR